MAAQGLLGPQGKTVPILTALRCIHFQPPHFTLGKTSSSEIMCPVSVPAVDGLCVSLSPSSEVQCVNETQKYLRKVVHEIGLELRSTAVCKGVRRTRDGGFTLQDALTRQHWTVSDVMEAIRQYHMSKKGQKTPRTQIRESQDHKQAAGSHQNETSNDTESVTRLTEQRN